MSRPDHAGRCVQAIERLSEVLQVEFDDLGPPAKAFVLQQMLFQFHHIFYDHISPSNRVKK